MQLNRELLTKFVGGDMEIVDPTNVWNFRGTIFRGPIKGVVFKRNGWLKVKFFWLAWAYRAVDWPDSAPSTWTKFRSSHLSIPPTDFSECSKGELISNRLTLDNSITLFPPNGEHLDPARVAGL